jgi:hypothetical protein
MTNPRKRTEGAPGRGLLSVLEIIVLGVANLFLVVLVIPYWSGVETWCWTVGGETAAADHYATAILIIGSGSWLGMIAATILAFRFAHPTVGVLVPLGWFIALASVATIITSAMGPQPCQGSPGLF